MKLFYLLLALTTYLTPCYVKAAHCSRLLKTLSPQQVIEKGNFSLPFSEESFRLMHPSQHYFGLPKVAYVTKKIADEGFDYILDRLEEKLIYVVRDPKGTLWIVDAHHHALALFYNFDVIKKRYQDKLNELNLNFSLVDDFTNRSEQEFKSFMMGQQYIYLREGESVASLPVHIGGLRADYGRGLAYLLIKGGLLSKADNTPFIEFYVADVLAKHYLGRSGDWQVRTLLNYKAFITRNPQLFAHIKGLSINKTSNSKFKKKVDKYLSALQWYENK